MVKNKIFIVFSIYHLITRKQRNPIRQEVCHISFIGVAPTHLTRGPIARSIIILYIVMAQSATLFVILKYHRSESIHHRAVVI